jgi:hypothetical protein
MVLVATNAVFAAVVTNGFYRVSSSEGVFEMSGEGPSFRFKGWFYYASSVYPYGPVNPGWVDANATVAGGDLGAGSALIGATEVRVDYGSEFARPGAGIFRFTGSVLVTGPGQFTGPFEFTGGICGTTDDLTCALYLPELTGRGTVVLNVQDIAGYLDIRRATYIFAVPEPSTFLLIAPFAIVLAVCRRVQRLRLMLRADVPEIV